VALEPDDHAAVHAEREVERYVDGDDEQDPLAGFSLRRGDLEEMIEVERDARRGRVGDEPHAREHEEERARDLVQRLDVPVGAVLRHELDERPGIPEIEHGEVHGDRSEQHPEPVLRGAEVRQVEREHDQADDRLHEDRHVPGRDVPRDGDDLPLAAGGPGALAVSAHAAPFRKSTTLTVSKTMVRSKNTERCLM
jgi:hypothetical protein